VSESLVGKTPVSGALCQREAELVRCGVVGSPPGSKPGSNFAFANRVVPVRLIKSGLKWKFRFAAFFTERPSALAYGENVRGNIRFIDP
jgi:hypothetical protein